MIYFIFYELCYIVEHWFDHETQIDILVYALGVLDKIPDSKCCTAFMTLYGQLEAEKH